MQVFIAGYCEISLIKSVPEGGTILNQEQKQTDITTGKQIRHLRTQSGMTQEELTGQAAVCSRLCFRKNYSRSKRSINAR